MTNANDPISYQLDWGNQGIKQEGLTKLEYFAAMAMQGLLTRVPNRDNRETDLGVKESKRIAEESTIMANELIKALNENQVK